MKLSLLAGRIDRPILRPWAQRWRRTNPDYFAAILDASPYTSLEILLRML